MLPADVPLLIIFAANTFGDEVCTREVGNGCTEYTSISKRCKRAYVHSTWRFVVGYWTPSRTAQHKSQISIEPTILSDESDTKEQNGMIRQGELQLQLWVCVPAATSARRCCILLSGGTLGREGRCLQAIPAGDTAG